jgi:hypothetical protein
MSGEPVKVALALVHYPVVDRLGSLRATSVTPLNVHDLSRSAKTYGVSPLYIVTPILSQQALVGRILKHWREGYGSVQNPTRKEALRDVMTMSSLNEAADDIFRRNGDYPLVVSTSARSSEGHLDYGDLAEKIAKSKRPWLLLFGTGWGLAPEAVEQCDYLLGPIRGGETYNHLSVRSAVAIVLDRLFGK